MKPGSKISAERIRTALQNRFNPIRGLEPELLSQQLDQFKIGHLRSLAITWDAMENRDPFLKGVMMKRKKSIARAGWEILAVDDSPEAEAQKEALEFFYNHVTATSVLEQNERGGLKLLIRQMADAIGKRFAVHEIVWKPVNTGLGKGSLKSALTAEFRFCPLWFFENRTGRLQFLQAEYEQDGIVMPDNEWLVTVGDGIMEALSVAYIYKHMSLKDWVSFNEKHAFPIPLGKTTATKDSAEWDAMVEAVQGIVNDFAAVVSQGEEIELLETSAAGNLPFPPLVEYMDRVIATLARGGDLSTISQGGPGVGASLQGDESSMLVEDDAELISETLNTNIDRFVIQQLFGSDQPLAYIKILTPQKENTDRDIKIDEHLTKHGARLAIKDAAERYGRSLAEDDEPCMTVPVDTSAKASYSVMQHSGREFANDSGRDEATPKLLKNAVLQLSKAQAGVLQPVRERIEAILSLEDPKLFEAAVKLLRADLPALLRDINQDPATARVLEDALGAALLNGFVTGKVSKI